MKISKSVLVSSMALAGIVLGTVAPTTVQAATTGLVQNNEGKLIDSDKNNETINLNDGQTAYVGSSKNADATSEASVEVISGYLTLEAVPDFSFGRTIGDSVAKLQSNASAIDNDGNQSGVLRVTESRTKDNSTPTQPGFNISASMTPFKNISNPSNTATGFILTLNPMNFVNVSDKTVSRMTTSPVSLDGKNNGTIASVQGDQDKPGQYEANFVGDKAAKLFVPKDAEKGGSVNKYAAEITWTLSSGADSTPEKTVSAG